MKNLVIVIKFTIKEMVRKKSFIISTLLILALVVLGFSAPKIIDSLKGENSKAVILISDSQDIFEGNLDSLKQMDLPNYDIRIENADFASVKKKIEDEQIKSAIIFEKENEQIKMKYVVESLLWEDQIPEDLVRAINSIYSNMQIGKLGLTPEQLQALTPNFETTVEQTKDEEVDGANVLVMMAVSVVLSISIIFFTAQVATSITTEKTSKIMETLVTSTSPRTIVLGKTMGIGLVGLFQVVLVVATALICANTLLDAEMVKTFFEMVNITPGFIVTIIIYFILGYFAYALLYALTGSLVSKPEDIQSANTPISMIAMIGFYLGYFSISIDPTSSISSFASMFPISSPFCMPSRFMMGLASWTDVVISVVLLIAMVALIAKIAIKVYSSAILNYGAKLSIKDALKMYKQK